MLIGILAAGGLGAVCRYAVDSALTRRLKAPWPLPILIINVVGSFITGLLTGATVSLPVLSVCVTGFCGAFTTFSTLVVGWLEMVLQRRARSGFVYLVGSVLACVLSVWLGLVLGGSFA